MITFTPSNNFANSVSPFSNVGQVPVGQEGVENRNTVFQAVEETTELAESINRRNPEERPSETEERQRLRDARAGQSSGNQQAISSAESEGKAAAKQDVEAKQLASDQAEIQQLSARDREVRAHEQAHKSVGGQYAGAMSFTFVRGPDGVAYAVGGEVSISTSAISGDLEATIQKMQTIQRAALAPAEPSPQDRRVAAEAVQQMVQARADLAAMKREEQTQSSEKIAEEEAVKAAEKEAAQVEDERDAIVAEQNTSATQGGGFSFGPQFGQQNEDAEFSFFGSNEDKQSALERFENINRISRNVSNRMIELGLTSSSPGFTVGQGIDNFV